MEARGRRPPLYDEAKKLLTALPAAASALRVASALALPEGAGVAIAALPEGSGVAIAGVSVLLLLLLRKCLRRKRKPAKNTPRAPPTGKSDSHEGAWADHTPITDTLEGSIQRTSEPARVTADRLLEQEKEELAKKLNDAERQLADTNHELSTLRTQHAALQQEHAALQQRYTRQEHAAPDTLGELNYVTLSELESCATARTPTPSIQSEPPASSEVGAATPAPPSGRSLVESPLKHRFRKKKSARNKR